MRLKIKQNFICIIIIMKSLSLLILIVGIVFVTVGYMDNKVSKLQSEKKIEYRFVPRTIYDEQIRPVNLTDTFSSMFSNIDPIFEGK
tara:strand:- start:1321 stop:1581 length:261 start_codon:yes stop_codon:yes gene_type:complete